jgi:hypothetical protein
LKVFGIGKGIAEGKAAKEVEHDVGQIKGEDD